MTDLALHFQQVSSTMAQSASLLLSLPPEVFLHIVGFLSPADQAHLCTTSKAASNFIEHLLWRDIELHDVGFHESSAELKDPPPFIAPSRRRYLNNRGHGGSRYNGVRRIAFFYMLDKTYKADRPRFEHLTARIHSLCTVIDYPYNEDCSYRNGQDELMWNLFPHMVNLEVLELHAEWLGSEYDPTPFDGLLLPLSRLRFAKLIGHLPREFARYVVLGSAPTLERLELGLLDCPITGPCIHEPGIDAPVRCERRIPDMESEARGENGSSLDNRDQEDHDNHNASNSTYDEWVLDYALPADYDWPDNGAFGGYFAPRPLSILPSPQDASSDTSDQGDKAPVFPKLKHLYLYKPSEGQIQNELGDVFYPSRARSASADDWCALLIGAEKTVETLVLEHRPCIGVSALDTECSWRLIRTCSRGWDESYFVKNVLPLLFSNKGEFKRLKELFLYGIFIESTKSIADRNKLVDLCQRRDLKCEGRFGRGCFFDEYYGEIGGIGDNEGIVETDEEGSLHKYEGLPKKTGDLIWKT